MSFLAYFLRAYPDSLSEYQDRIPDFVIRLLQDCPPEASATRKVVISRDHIKCLTCHSRAYLLIPC